MTKFFAMNTATAAVTEFEATAPFDAAAYLPAGSYRIAAASAYATADLVIAAPGPSAAPGAVGHWLLGADNTGHSGLVGGALTPVGSTVSLSSGYVTTPPALLSGLRSALPETPALTIACVARVTDGCILMNDYGSAPGVQLVRVSSGFLLANATGSGNEILSSGADGGGVWKFIAATVGAGGTLGLYVRGAGPATVDTRSGARGGLSSNPIGIGPVFHGGNSGYANSFDIAEFIVFDTARTTAELDALYAASVERMGARGITLG